jgi:radical SAM family uncharacterized protein/radical SAM-linked protein
MDLHETLLNGVLPSVTKPSRYLGTEFNVVHKDPMTVALRVALAFPDLYDLGLGNLGLHILYTILNDLPWCWAERAYAPAPDMEAAMRNRGLPLFALESKEPLASMDMIGFSLQSELTYTSVLNMLDLAGLPLRSKDRNDRHPLVFAGGPGAFNPEPLAPFIDFFVIGDGEEAILDVAQTALAMRGLPCDERLAAFACIEGVYAPGLYPFETAPGGRILPNENAPKVARRVLKDLNAARFPARYIVPFTQLIHDRVGIEVLRGCTHGCRFCQGGMTTRPVRTRNLEAIGRIMEQTLSSTGYEEVSLLSLSTCDYPRIAALLEQSSKTAQAVNAAVSVPSLRLDTFSIELADAISHVRRSGLTFAPETASPRLRSVINKWFDDDALFEVVTEAFKRGWEHVKCYFMIGLPTETDEDVRAIADLCVSLLEKGRAITRRARIFTGVSTFVPKPFTPFQWAGQIGFEETQRRQRILEQGFRRHSGIKFGRHDPEASFIEGLLARADRRAADLIEAAFRHGARLDSSSEHINFKAWQDAIAETGYDVEGAFCERSPDERLPWDHIDVHIPKRWFHLEWQRALELAHTPDCRTGRCSGCGLRDIAPGLCSAMIDDAQRGVELDREKAVLKLPECVEPPALQRLRFRVGRTEEARFLSNLEWMSAWIRALRRAQAPLSHSQGFHAHPKVTFAAAPPVGEESEGDYMDVVLCARVKPGDLLDRVRATLPKGFHIYDVAEVPTNAPSLMSLVSGFDYTLVTQGDPGRLQTRIDELLAMEVINIERKGRPTGVRQSRETSVINIRPTLHILAVRSGVGSEVAIDFRTRQVDGKLAKPREIIALLGLDPATTRVLKRETHLS